MVTVNERLPDIRQPAKLAVADTARWSPVQIGDQLVGNIYRYTPAGYAALPTWSRAEREKPWWRRIATAGSYAAATMVGAITVAAVGPDLRGAARARGRGPDVSAGGDHSRGDHARA
jgi:hypothetical protein